MYNQNSKGHTHVFEVELYSDVNIGTVRHPLIPEVDIAATKPEAIISRVAGGSRGI